MSEMNALQIQVHAVLEDWAKATRQNRKDEILKMPDGQTFQDLVRATFCLEKIDGAWKILHRHMSKPTQQSGS